MEYKTRITKCYLIEVTDKDGYAVAEDWCFGTRKDAEKKVHLLKALKQQEDRFKQADTPQTEQTDCSWK